MSKQVKHTPTQIWVCHSSECEGTWTDDEYGMICPSVDCSNKNVTPYILKSSYERIEKQLEDLLEAAEEYMDTVYNWVKRPPLSTFGDVELSAKKLNQAIACAKEENDAKS